MLFVEQKDFVWGLIASMYLGNVVAVVLVLLTVADFRGADARAVLHHRTGDRHHLHGRGPTRFSNSYLDVML